MIATIHCAFFVQSSSIHLYFQHFHALQLDAFTSQHSLLRANASIEAWEQTELLAIEMSPNAKQWPPSVGVGRDSSHGCSCTYMST